LRNEIYGVGFDNVDINEATDIALALMDREHASYVVTPNAEILWMCHKEEKLRKKQEKEKKEAEQQVEQEVEIKTEDAEVTSNE